MSNIINKEVSANRMLAVCLYSGMTMVEVKDAIGASGAYTLSDESDLIDNYLTKLAPLAESRNTLLQEKLQSYLAEFVAVTGLSVTAVGVDFLLVDGPIDFKNDSNYDSLATISARISGFIVNSMIAPIIKIENKYEAMDN
jgi:hypothetical protein